MKPESGPKSVRSTPRIQQPRRTLSPPEYAAAGDAPHGQTSPDLNLGTPLETVTMNTALFSTAIKKGADSSPKIEFNNPCAHPNAGRDFTSSDDPLENFLSVIDKKSLAIRCRSVSKHCTIDENSDHRNSPDREQPSKEYSHDTLRFSNYQNLSDNERKSLSELTSDEGVWRNPTEGHSVDKIVPPIRKVSMFSAEIWTEKVLPIDTFVCPEPELVEIYFDKNKTTGELNCYRDYSTESIDVSSTWRGSSRGVLGRSRLASPLLSARKSRTSSSGQKTVNFDDEIWPVCPKLLPSGKELLDSSVFGNSYEAISPEKLNDDGEEIAAVSRLRTRPLKSASIFGVSSRASTNQYDLEDNPRSDRTTEPTHEAEGQSDFEAIRSQAMKFCDNHSRTGIPRSSISDVEKVRSFHNFDRIPRERSLIVDVVKQGTKKNRKCVKTVRFKSSGRHGGLKINRSGTKLQAEDRDTEPGQSTIHLAIDNTSHTPDSMCVESFKLEIDQLADQIARQIEASDDAVETLAKVEIIVEANRRAVERLQQLQPHVIIPRLIPSDAGKSIAETLMRCRSYMQTNGYSRDATNTLNKLLMSPAQSLKQLVEREKLALAQERRRATPGGGRRSKKSHHEILSNANGFSTADELAGNEVQYLISDLLTLTEKIVPKLNAKETQRKSSVMPTCSRNSAKTVARNTRGHVDTPYSKTDNTSYNQASKISMEAYESTVTHPLGAPEPNKVDEAFENCSEKSTAMTLSESPLKQFRGNHRVDKESSIPAPICPKRIASTEPTKTLKKLFNDLWEKRSKTLPRHYAANDSTNNFQPLAGPHNAPFNQRLPVWKPGGNKFNHPSMSAITNSKRMRPAPTSSSVTRQKNTSIEYTRSTKLHQRIKTIPGIVKDPSKITEKSITMQHNASSQAKIRTVTAKGHSSEVVSLDRSKVQAIAKIDETRSRKPRSKSRTQTTTSNKISRLTVTEIPLEHTEGCSTLEEDEISAAKELPLSRRASSSPKDIILMLEELIKSSGNETSIQNVHPVSVVARCDVAVKNVNKVTKSKGKLTNVTDSTLASESGDHGAQESSENQSIRLESVERMAKSSTISGEMDDTENLCDEQTPSLQDTVAEPCSLHKEFDSTLTSNAEEVLAVSRSSSECTAELSSEFPIASVSSKCCQASLTSLTSHDISEESIPGQMTDTGATSCYGGSTKNSNESFDSVEDGEVIRNHLAEHSLKDQSTLASRDTTKKKFVNKHAKSLEMLKVILSDQGLGIHLLSRAENELRDKCKCSSNRTARRSLQGANLTSSRVERNCSTTLFGKLATLSESEDDFEHVEVATMTSGNDATTTSGEFDSHCGKKDKALLSKVVTVENATQFDIPSKSDMCVGDDVICDTSVPLILESQKINAREVPDVYSSPATSKSINLTHEGTIVDKRESIECKLPNGILNAFQWAAVRATNLYAAVNILKKNMASESTIQSDSALIVDSNEILRQMPTTKSLTLAVEKSDHVQSLCKAFNTSQESEKPEIASPTKIIIPKILRKVNEETNYKAPTKKNADNLARSEITGRCVTSVKEANGHTTDDKLQNAYHPNNGHLPKPPLPPKPLFVSRKAFGTAVETHKFEKEQSINPSPVLTMENKSSDSAKILQSALSVQKVDCPSPSSSHCPAQQSLVEGTMTGKRIETLHFAGNPAAHVVRSTSNVGSEFTNKLLNATLLSSGSSKDEGKNRDPFTGSRIRTLLQENLHRLKTDYDPIIDGNVFKDFRDRILPDCETSDEEVVLDKVLAETTTSTSSEDLEDCKILSEVKNLVNCLLNEVEEISESSTMTEDHDLNIHSPQYRRIKKPVRRLKPERTRRIVKYGKRPISCGRYWTILSGMIVSREHLLSLIYAATCSFVFCCLQFSVNCEVQ